MNLLLLPYSQIIEWVCLITSILFLRSAKPKYWRVFIIYLLITVIVEDWAYYIAHYARHLSNHWLYNIFLVIYASFHLWVFSKIINLPNINKICLSLLVVIGGFYVWEWNNQGLENLFYRSNTVFGISVTLLSIYYYYSLFKQDTYIEILKDPAFWFVTGCLIFYATSTGVNAFFLQILNGNHKIRYFVLTFLNLFMYSCWMKSFLCLYKNKSSIRSSSL